MRPSRHKFCLLSLARRHNVSISKGEANYLHPSRKPMQHKIKPYGCHKKNIKGTFTMKMMKSKNMKLLKKPAHKSMKYIK